MAERIEVPRLRGAFDGELPPPPTTLSDLAADVWRQTVERYALDPGRLLVLRGGMEWWDIYADARDQLVREGATVTNPDSGVVRRHPAASVMKDAYAAFRQSFRQLNLPVPEPDEEAYEWED
jgi:phage terminase small subunit